MARGRPHPVQSQCPGAGRKDGRPLRSLSSWVVVKEEDNMVTFQRVKMEEQHHQYWISLGGLEKQVGLLKNRLTHQNFQSRSARTSQARVFSYPWY